ARAILEGLPKESGPWSSTEDCPRRRGVSSRSTKRDRAGLSDRVRSYFARPSSRARSPRSRRNPPPSPPPRRPNVDLAHPARNERLHTGYERVIRLSFTKHNRCPRRHESINATVQLNIESDSRISGRRLSSVAFHAQLPDLRFASLMNMDFATSRPLVQRSRLISGSCPSTRTFAPRF